MQITQHHKRYQLCWGKFRGKIVLKKLFLVLNFIGLGLGPLITGALSDIFGQSMGAGAGLRWALVLVTLATVWAAIHYFRAARTLREDLAKAPV